MGHRMEFPARHLETPGIFAWRQRSRQVDQDRKRGLESSAKSHGLKPSPPAGRFRRAH
jgi:hypothetical protein